MEMTFILLLLVSSLLRFVAKGQESDATYPELPLGYDARTEANAQAACIRAFPQLSSQAKAFTRAGWSERTCAVRCRDQEEVIQFRDGLPCVNEKRDKERKVCWSNPGKLIKGCIVTSSSLAAKTGETSWMAQMVCGLSFFQSFWASIHSKGPNRCQVDCYLTIFSDSKISYLPENTECEEFAVCKSTGKKNKDGQKIRECVEDTPKREDAEIRRLLITPKQKEVLLRVAENTRRIAEFRGQRPNGRMWEVVNETGQMLDVVDGWMDNDIRFRTAIKELEVRKKCRAWRNKN